MKTLLLDIETAPNLAWVWGKYEQDVIAFEHEWYMLCVAYKWLGEKKVYTLSLPNYKNYYKETQNDGLMVTELAKIMAQADIIVAHNGDHFDIPRINSRLVVNGIKPLPPIKTVDTLKVARKYFSFNSNKLNDLGQLLNLGKKVPTGGFGLWKGCMEGDMKSWALMLKYNVQDVKLLEEVYLKLRPWMTNHPNVNVVDETQMACPTCGSKKIQKRGFSPTPTGQKQRYQCMMCSSWSHGTSKKTVEIR